MSLHRSSCPPVSARQRGWSWTLCGRRDMTTVWPEGLVVIRSLVCDDGSWGRTRLRQVVRDYWEGAATAVKYLISLNYNYGWKHVRPRSSTRHEPCRTRRHRRPSVRRGRTFGGSEKALTRTNSRRTHLQLGHFEKGIGSLRIAVCSESV